jgi:hypothetical protein
MTLSLLSRRTSVMVTQLIACTTFADPPLVKKPWLWQAQINCRPKDSGGRRASQSKCLWVMMFNVGAENRLQHSGIRTASVPLSLSAACARSRASLMAGGAADKPIYARAFVQVSVALHHRRSQSVLSVPTLISSLLPSRIATAVSGEVGGDANPLSHDNRGHQSACHHGAGGIRRAHHHHSHNLIFRSHHSAFGHGMAARCRAGTSGDGHHSTAAGRSAATPSRHRRRPLATAGQLALHELRARFGHDRCAEMKAEQGLE